MGFEKDATPCCSTLHYLFKALDASVFERAIGRWLRGRRAAGLKAVSIDGKRLCGTQGHPLPGVHLIALFEHQAQAVIGQVAVDAAKLLQLTRDHWRI